MLLATETAHTDGSLCSGATQALGPSLTFTERKDSQDFFGTAFVSVSQSKCNFLLKGLRVLWLKSEIFTLIIKDYE